MREDKGSTFKKVEDTISYIMLILLAFIPAMEVLARLIFHTGVPGSSEYIHHIVIWVTFLGGMITSREGKHLSLSIGVDTLQGRIKDIIQAVTAVISATIVFSLGWGALSLILIGFDSSTLVGLLPIRAVIFIMPLGLFVIAARFLPAIRKRSTRIIALLIGLFISIFISFPAVLNILYSITFNVPLFFDVIWELSYSVTSFVTIPAVILLIIAAAFGTPIFVVLGGIAHFLFMWSGGSPEVIPNEAYTLLIGNIIPSIPLFTFAGFILSESKAGHRLVSLFRALFGWLPGGMVIMAVVVCAFFTTFTGASGVTILALGGLLAYILVESGKFPKPFSHGLLTSSGSIGLLFPPSLPIIMYGVTAQISIKDMFIGGILPGAIMVIALSSLGVITAVRRKTERIKFSTKNVIAAIKESIWVVLLPVVILLLYFGGITTLVETGAVAVIYCLIIEIVIHRDLKLKDLPMVFKKCVPIIGGVLVILAFAKGFSYYIVDMEVPMQLTAWVQEHIHSKYVFLIILNLVLLLTGCLMDIFSAILVVAPLVIPLGEVFGIQPVHLGIIFLANLELGYLTPPVGMNLFLSSYRFNEPLSKVYRNVFPFFLLLLGTVLVITYVPWFSTVLLHVFGP